MIALAFDTETTGLIESRLLRLELQPHVISICLVLVDLDSGEEMEDFQSLIRPPRPDLLDKKITKLTGIGVEDLESAPSFAAVAGKIFSMIESAPMAAAHNFSFDKAMIDLEARRLGRAVAWPRKTCCTVETSIHVYGYNADLTKLHSYLLGREFDDAHSARGDVDALVACLREMRRRDML